MGRTLLLPIIFLSLSIGAQESGTSCPTIENPIQIFCQSQGTGNYYYRPSIAHLAVTDNGGGVLWYSSLDGEIPLATNYILVDGETYYAGDTGRNCKEWPSVEVTVFIAPNAGSTTNYIVCSNDPPFDLFEDYKPSQLGLPDTDGTFHPELKSGTSIFNPALDEAGQYTYRVKSTNEQCPDDESKVTIKIIPAPNSGDSGEAYFESNSPKKQLIDFLGGEPVEGGVWSPPLVDGIFDPGVNDPGIYVYTVTGEGNCTSSSTVTVTVNDLTSTICHKGATIMVKKNSLKGHLNHGDTVGPCSETTSETVVSPNPSRGIFSFFNESAEITQVRILNFKGSLIKEFSTSGAVNMFDIDISDLKQGIYFAEIITGNGKQIERLVKK